MARSAAVAALPTFPTDIDPRAEAALGRGATAGLRGSLGVAGGRIELLSGPSRGRWITADDGGRFEANGLVPGLHLARFHGGGLEGAERELALRPPSALELELDPARRVDLEGLVVDESGEPIAGAEATLDGSTTRTDGAGRFRLAGLVDGRGGAARLVLAAPGRALRTESLRLAEATSGVRRFTLEPACALELALEARGDLAGAAEVLVLADTPLGDGRGEHGFPWERLGPELRLAPGTSLVLDGLPAGEFRVSAASPLGRARPERVRLGGAFGTRARVVLTLEPLPRAEVTSAATPGSLARLRLESCDVLRATLAAFGLEPRDVWRRPIDPAAATRLELDPRALEAGGILRVACVPGRAEEACLRGSDAAGHLVALRLLEPRLELAPR